MTITADQALTVQKLADIYGERCSIVAWERGLANTTILRQREVEARRNAAWQALSDAIFALAEDSPQPEGAAGGVKSSPAEDPCGRRKIDTLQELDDLPEGVVVLDPHDSGYQKYSKMHWEGLGRTWDSIQIQLPVTVIFEPEVKA